MHGFVLVRWVWGLLSWSSGILVQEISTSKAHGGGTWCTQVRQPVLVLCYLLKLVYAEGWRREMASMSYFVTRERTSLSTPLFSLFLLLSFSSLLSSLSSLSPQGTYVYIILVCPASFHLIKEHIFLF